MKNFDKATRNVKSMVTVIHLRIKYLFHTHPLRLMDAVNIKSVLKC